MNEHEGDHTVWHLSNNIAADNRRISTLQVRQIDTVQYEQRVDGSVAGSSPKPSFRKNQIYYL